MSMNAGRLSSNSATLVARGSLFEENRMIYVFHLDFNRYSTGRVADPKNVFIVVRHSFKTTALHYFVSDKVYTSKGLHKTSEQGE